MFKVNPPLRTDADVAALRAALVEGVIDVVATDHAPHAVEDKECEWAYARPGMLGLETALSVVRPRSCSSELGWDGIAERMSRPPARIAGLAGHGHDPAPGRPANLTLVDPAAPWTVEPAALASRSRNTPYAGMTLPGPGGGHVPAGRPRRCSTERRSGEAPGSQCWCWRTGAPSAARRTAAWGRRSARRSSPPRMTGYQETLTDPSYHRQVVVQTAPHIGNTGVNDEDDESEPDLGGRLRGPRPGPDPVQLARHRRAWRTGSAAEGVVGISGIDTRALTRHLRERGAMRVGVSSVDTDPTALRQRVLASPPMVGADLSAEVSTPTRYTVAAQGEHRFTVAALDLGIKRNVPGGWPPAA